jgi:hypothetical protein
VDVSRFRVGDWVLVAAGAVMLVLGLAVPWVTVTFRGADLGGARNAFNYPLTGGVAWLLVVGAGVITFLRAAQLLHGDRLPWTRLIVYGCAAAVLLLLLRLVIGAGGNSRAELGRGAGMAIALLAAVVATAGALLNQRAEGGTLADLWSFGPRRTTGRPLPPPDATRRGNDVPPSP